VIVGSMARGVESRSGGHSACCAGLEHNVGAVCSALVLVFQSWSCSGTECLNCLTCEGCQMVLRAEETGSHTRLREEVLVVALLSLVALLYFGADLAD